MDSKIEVPKDTHLTAEIDALKLKVDSLTKRNASFIDVIKKLMLRVGSDLKMDSLDDDELFVAAKMYVADESNIKAKPTIQILKTDSTPKTPAGADDWFLKPTYKNHQEVEE